MNRVAVAQELVKIARVILAGEWQIRAARTGSLLVEDRMRNRIAVISEDGKSVLWLAPGINRQEVLRFAQRWLRGFSW